MDGIQAGEQFADDIGERKAPQHSVKVRDRTQCRIKPIPQIVETREWGDWRAVAPSSVLIDIIGSKSLHDGPRYSIFYNKLRIACGAIQSFSTVAGRETAGLVTLDGITLLPQIAPPQPVVMPTAYGPVQTAVGRDNVSISGRQDRPLHRGRALP